VGYLMKRVLSSVLAQADDRLASLDLTHAQWLPLFKLAVKECHTVAALARELELDPGAMTRSLDRLEAKGLVRRERSTEDRRVVNLVLTDEGRQVARQVPPVMAEVLNNHLRGFSEDEWKQLIALLTRMVANGDAMRQPPAA
jgi:DNA-binding MarR family transcriptional regulator